MLRFWRDTVIDTSRYMPSHPPSGSLLIIHSSGGSSTLVAPGCIMMSCPTRSIKYCAGLYSLAVVAVFLFFGLAGGLALDLPRPRALLAGAFLILDVLTSESLELLDDAASESGALSPSSEASSIPPSEESSSLLSIVDRLGEGILSCVDPRPCAADRVFFSPSMSWPAPSTLDSRFSRDKIFAHVTDHVVLIPTLMDKFLHAQRGTVALDVCDHRSAASWDQI